MNKQEKVVIFIGIFILIILTYLVFNYYEGKNNAQVANPASVYCGENNGSLEIRTNSDGSQTGYCIFQNGSECEEWAFYRGECEG
ncbi:MAG: DUF333 domain-containing protein [Nanoarchaeota archaeon]|nr:DUF333 domain-containing protein [Nanoarchaeota archaeon]